MIGLVEQKSLGRYLPGAMQWLEAGLEYNAEKGMTIEQLLDDIRIGNYLLIVDVCSDVVRGAATIERYRENGRSICLVVTAAHDDVTQRVHYGFLSHVERLAKRFNCDAVQIKGRAGWARRLKADGYKSLCTILEKAVR